MNWDNATILKFIELYKINSCIWDPQNIHHKNRQCVNDAWNNIKKKMGTQCTVKELKKKKESLMAAYRGYKNKIRKSESSDSCDVYQPIWFAFPLMDSFLHSVYNCNSTSNTEVERNTLRDHLPRDPLETKTENNDDYLESEQQSEYTQPSTSSDYETPNLKPVRKRRLDNPPELVQAQKQMEQAFQLMQNVYQKSKDEDDECTVFGILIAKKLRKLSEERRDVMMTKINQLFVEERRDIAR